MFRANTDHNRFMRHPITHYLHGLTFHGGRKQSVVCFGDHSGEDVFHAHKGGNKFSCRLVVHCRRRTGLDNLRAERSVRCAMLKRSRQASTRSCISRVFTWRSFSPAATLLNTVVSKSSGSWKTMARLRRYSLEPNPGTIACFL